MNKMLSKAAARVVVSSSSSSSCRPLSSLFRREATTVGAAGHITSSSSIYTGTTGASVSATSVRSFQSTSAIRQQQEQQQQNYQIAESPGLFQKLSDRYGVKGQQKRIILASHLFNTAERQSLHRRHNDNDNADNGNNNSFFCWHKDFKVDINFRARQSLLTTHVWMINRRLVHEAREQQQQNQSQQEQEPPSESQQDAPKLQLPDWGLVQQEFLETFWHDTKVRIRAEGVRELSVDKGLRDVQNYSLQQCMALDHVVDKFPFDNTNNTNKNSDIDKRARIDNLGVVLWSNVYYGCHDGESGGGESGGNAGSHGGVPDEYVDAMAHYVLDAYDHVMHKLPTKYFAEGRVAWTQPKDIATVLPPWEDSFVTEDRIVEKMGTRLPKHWYTALTEAGHRYYWNDQTRDVSWDMPLHD
jgi:hypothetical protein